MSELGKTLSQARVARGLTLEDCERDTRISKRYLDALEREDWKIFPAPVYSRAFLRTYAQYLSLDGHALVAMLKAQEEPEIRPLPEIRQAPSTGAMNWPLAGGVVVFLMIAAVFLYITSRGTDGQPLEVGAQSTPTIITEASGGGIPQPAVGRPLGEIRKGVVPDLAGVRLDDALAALAEAEIDYVVLESDSVTGTAGVVSTQDPQPGTRAGGNTSVTLVVPGS